MKNVRSSGTASSFRKCYELIQEVTERELPVYVAQSKTLESRAAKAWHANKKV